MTVFVELQCASGGFFYASSSNPSLWPSIRRPGLPLRLRRGDGIESLGLDELLAGADYVTLHCPMTPKTRGLLNAGRLAAMKRGARVINCARGGLVDEQALHDALKSGHLAGAALDVFEQEPPGESPLLQLDNVVATPHIAAVTRDALATKMRAAFANMQRVARGQAPCNVVEI